MERRLASIWAVYLAFVVASVVTISHDEENRGFAGALPLEVMTRVWCANTKVNASEGSRKCTASRPRPCDLG